MFCREIEREVPNYVPSDLPLLSGSFRVLHDAAATGSPLPEGGGARGVDGAPVTPEAVAATVADNYARCRYDQIRLSALQKIVETIRNSERLYADE